MKLLTTSRRAVRRCLLRALEPCQQMVPLMSESLERRLGVVEWLKLKGHLLVCAWCSRYFTQIKFLRGLMRLQTPAVVADDAAPRALSAEARERIANRLRQSKPTS